MDIQNFLNESLKASAEVKEKIAEDCSQNIIDAVNLLVESLKNGNKLLVCGNGGSSSDAQHIAAEFMIRLAHDIERPAIPAIALTTNHSILTAGGNDIGFENVFSREVEGLGSENDVLLVITTSGNSENIVRAIDQAKKQKLKTIGFLGGDGGKCKDKVDIPIIIPSSNVQRIQEGHITIAHIICELVEKGLYS